MQMGESFSCKNWLLISGKVSLMLLSRLMDTMCKSKTDLILLFCGGATPPGFLPSPGSEKVNEPQWWLINTLH